MKSSHKHTESCDITAWKLTQLIIKLIDHQCDRDHNHYLRCNTTTDSGTYNNSLSAESQFNIRHELINNLKEDKL